MTGGYVYIYHSQEMPYAWKNDDGYQWSEILHQMDMLTAKGLEILNSETIGAGRREEGGQQQFVMTQWELFLLGI